MAASSLATAAWNCSAAPGNEVENGRGVHGNTERLVRGGVDLGGGQAAQVGQPLAQPPANRQHQLDLADAVLEAHQVRAARGQALERVRAQAADVAVVDDDADADRPAQRLDVSGEAVLRGLGQVVGQQQQARGAEPLGFARERDRCARRPAGAGEDGDPAAAGLDSDADDLGVLRKLEREELAGAARCEQRRALRTARATPAAGRSPGAGSRPRRRSR